MRVCIVATEFLGYGSPSGGIGVGARVLARNLVGRRVETIAIVPGDRSGVLYSPEIEGITIRTYDRRNLAALWRHVRAADADVYHHVQPSLGAYLAEKAMPDRAHVVECVDPRNLNDWLIEFRLPTHSAAKLVPAFVYFGARPAALSAKRADLVQVPAEFLREKARQVYGLELDPELVPSAFSPPHDVMKSSTPLVVFVGRLVRRKQPEIFIDLARRFPDIQFTAIGPQIDPHYAKILERRAASLANLTLTGFIDPTLDAGFSRHLSKAWILVNSAAREGLPLTFIEAAGHRCAILSECDPDGYASNFGYHVTDGDYARGLKWLLVDGRWRDAGERGYAHVKLAHHTKTAIDRQLSAYERALDGRIKKGGLSQSDLQRINMPIRTPSSE